MGRATAAETGPVGLSVGAEIPAQKPIKLPALVVEWVKPLAAVHTGQGSLSVRVEACLLPLRVIGLSAGVHAIGLFLDRHRGFTCVLFKM